MSINLMTAKTLVFFGAAALGCMALSSASFAQTSAGTACFSGSKKMPDADVQTFLKNPAKLLSDFASGGPAMAARVESLAGSDASTLDQILAQVPNAKPNQLRAIGKGVGSAANACVADNPEYSAKISKKVALLGNTYLDLGFKASGSEVETSATNSDDTVDPRQPPVDPLGQDIGNDLSGAGGVAPGVSVGTSANEAAGGSPGGATLHSNSGGDYLRGSFSSGVGGSISTVPGGRPVSVTSL